MATLESVLPLILYIAVPTVVLVCGGACFAFKSYAKKSLVGGMLAFLGAIELLFLLSQIKASIQISENLPIGLAASVSIIIVTVIAGVTAHYRYKPKLPH